MRIFFHMTKHHNVTTVSLNSLMERADDLAYVQDEDDRRFEGWNDVLMGLSHIPDETPDTRMTRKGRMPRHNPMDLVELFAKAGY